MTNVSRTDLCTRSVSDVCILSRKIACPCCCPATSGLVTRRYAYALRYSRSYGCGKLAGTSLAVYNTGAAMPERIAVSDERIYTGDRDRLSLYRRARCYKSRIDIWTRGSIKPMRIARSQRLERTDCFIIVEYWMQFFVIGDYLTPQLKSAPNCGGRGKSEMKWKIKWISRYGSRFIFGFW